MNNANNNRYKWLHIRLKEDRHARINNKFFQIHLPELSEYARRCIAWQSGYSQSKEINRSDFMTRAN